MAQHERLVIVGSGPAGYTAALYAARANLTPLVVEGMQPGGQLTITTEVENYPGFAEGVMGPELMERMKAQAERFGTASSPATVDPASTSRRGRSGSGRRADEFTADALIVATGASAKWLGIPSEQRLIGHGRVGLRHLRRLLLPGQATSPWWAAATPRWRRPPSSPSSRRKVYLVHRRDELRASKIMQERAPTNPKIEFVWNAAVDEVLGDGKAVTGVRLRSTKDGSTRGAPGPGLLRRHRPRAQHRPLRGPARHGRGRLPEGEGALDAHQPSRGSSPPATWPTRLPPGGHRRRLGLHGGDRRRALAGRAGNSLRVRQRAPCA